jgi:hypothetical protein
VEQYASMQAAAARCSVSSCENVQREISIERRVSRYLARGLCCVLIACTVALARSQESSTAENTLEGTVVSSTRELQFLTNTPCLIRRDIARTLTVRQLTIFRAS